MAGSDSSHNDKVRDQFSRQAESYGALTRAMASADLSAPLRAMVAAGPADHVLEVACGNGLLTLDMAPHVARATGLDLTVAMLAEARAAHAPLLAAGQASNVEWRAGDVTALPFADVRFSIVLCRAAFHHFAAPALAFAEMVRVCAPGGCIAVIDMTPDADKVAEFDRIERLRDPSHGHAHTLEELRALATGQPLGAPNVVTTDSRLPFAHVLATSFPESCSRDDLAALMAEDAASGEDRLGYDARIEDRTVTVRYPMSTLVWRKHGVD